ncbi:OBCAM-like protein [Mya arenaria]|uniref:OBCAM-like protein n=1 Tax=Mya arenaria TaxID=6604 RepID=A0ABY7GER4_MYAAR|nr:OBCAM-like protein [Mya arenaria]
MDVDNVTVKVTDTAILPCAIDFMGGHKVCINAILPCTIDFMGGHKVCIKAILPCTSDFIGGHKVCIKAVLPCVIDFMGGHKVCINAIQPCAINFMRGHKVCINAILPCAIDFIGGHNVCIKAILPCAIDFMGGHKVCINAKLPCAIYFIGGHNVCIKAILPCAINLWEATRYVSTPYCRAPSTSWEATRYVSTPYCRAPSTSSEATRVFSINAILPCAIDFMGGHKVFSINAILPCAINLMEGHKVCIDAILLCAINFPYFMGGHKVVWTDQWSTLLTLDDRRIIDDPRVSIVRPYKRDWNLHIWNVTYEDQGPYDCQVNSDPIQSKRVMLNVLVPSEIVDILSSRDRTVLEGSTAILVCTVTGVPTPEVSWYKLPYEGQSSAREIRPEVNMLTKHIGQYVGRDTVLYCEVVANPHGVMVWKKDRRDIDLMNKEKYTVDYYNGNIGTFKKTLILQIHNIQVEDFGKYVCFARNSIGQNKESMILYDYSVHDSPPTIMPETSVIEPFAKAPSKTPTTQKPDDIEIPREGSGVGTDKELFLNAVTQGANRPNKPSTTLNTHKPDAIEILGQGNDDRTDGEVFAIDVTTGIGPQQPNRPNQSGDETLPPGSSVKGGEDPCPTSASSELYSISLISSLLLSYTSLIMCEVQAEKDGLNIQHEIQRGENIYQFTKHAVIIVSLLYAFIMGILKYVMHGDRNT